MPRIVRGQSGGVEGTVEIMKHLSRTAVREIDRRAIDEFGLPGIALMENAGRVEVVSIGAPACLLRESECLPHS